MSFSIPSAKSRPNADSKTDARLRHPGVHCAVIREARGSEFSLTVKPLPGEGIMEMFSRLAVVLKDLDATIIHLMIFGSAAASAAGTETMRRIFGNIDWPVTWVEGAACDDNPIAGMQAFAFAGGGVRRIVLDGRVVGSVFENGPARHCLLGGMGPGQIGSPRAAQARQVFEKMGEAFSQAGFSLADTVRTWFFLDDMLSWYDEFNSVRTQVYSDVKFRSGSLPASTGVAGRNPGGATLTAGAWAMQPTDSSTRAEEVASPLQCPASAYGSSFSRALEISSAAGRRLFISGTASIAPGGETMWKDDARRQVERTMEVVDAILRSRGFTFSDLTRATAYFKHRADIQAFTEWCAARDLRWLPVVMAHCDICRDDLLFELEADAWSPGKVC